MANTKWEELSDDAREAMTTLGNCGPTVRDGFSRTVKGWVHDEDGTSKVYYDADDLRKLAAGMIEVADWLDREAEGV